MPLSSTFLVCQEHVETRLRESLTPVSIPVPVPIPHPLVSSPTRHLATSHLLFYILQPSTLYPLPIPLTIPFLTLFLPFFQCFPRSVTLFFFVSLFSFPFPPPLPTISFSVSLSVSFFFQFFLHFFVPFAICPISSSSFPSIPYIQARRLQTTTAFQGFTMDLSHVRST